MPNGPRGQSPFPGYPSPYGSTPVPPPPPPAQGEWNAWSIPGTPAVAAAPYRPPSQAYGPPPVLPTPQPRVSPPRGAATLPPIQPTESLSASMAALTFSAPAHQHPGHPPRQTSTYSVIGLPPKAPSPPRQANGLPSLTAPVPTIASLAGALPAVQGAGADPTAQIAWAGDVVALVERLQPQASATSTDSPTGPARIVDPELRRLADVAVPMVLQLSAAGAPASGQRLPRHAAEALYLRGTFANAGTYPEYVAPNPRTAFRDFEQAARNGHSAAWFKLGRDYETVGDAAHARDCFERGVKYGVESCLYVGRFLRAFSFTR